MVNFESGQIPIETGVPIQGEKKSVALTQKQGSFMGSAVRWIVDKNTYLPGISTVTGIFKVVTGALVGVGGVLGLALGTVSLGISVISPSARFSDKMATIASDQLKVGSGLIATGLREVFRGAVSSVPVVGGLVVLGVDKLVEKVGGDSKIHDPVYRLYLRSIKPLFEEASASFVEGKERNVRYREANKRRHEERLKQL